MSKKIKIFIAIAAVLAIAFFAIPEVEVKKTSKDSVAYLAEEMGYPPGICNFLVNTKLGRKLCYIGLKKEVKSQLRQAKREVKKALK